MNSLNYAVDNKAAYFLRTGGHIIDDLEILELLIAKAEGEKGKLPVLKLRPNMFSLDFDTLPACFQNNWLHFFNALKNDLDNSDLEDDTYTLFRSPRGKVKVVVAANLPRGVKKLEKSHISQFIRNTIGDKYLKYADLQGAAVSSVILHDIEVFHSILALQWGNLDAVIHYDNLEVSIERPTRAYEIRFQGELPDWTMLGTKGRGVKPWREFVKLLLSIPSFKEGGTYQLSTQLIANALNTNANCAGKYLKRAIEMGILECTNEKYIPGKQARTYRLIDTELQNMVVGAPKREINKEIPKTWRGNFNEHIMSNVHLFTDLDAILDLYIKLGAFNDVFKREKRRKQLINTFKWAHGEG